MSRRNFAFPSDLLVLRFVHIRRQVCLFLLWKQFIIHQYINLSAKKNTVHTKIHPEHDEYNRCKASVHTGKSFEHIHIYRKHPRYDHPPQRGKYCSRKLSSIHISSVWEKLINQQQEYNHYNRCNNIPCPDQPVCHISKKWYMLSYKDIQAVTKYRQHKQKYNNEYKHYCINSCSYPKKKIVTCLTAIIHTVQS